MGCEEIFKYVTLDSASFGRKKEDGVWTELKINEKGEKVIVVSLVLPQFFNDTNCWGTRSVKSVMRGKVGNSPEKFHFTGKHKCFSKGEMYLHESKEQEVFVFSVEMNLDYEVVGRSLKITQAKSVGTFSFQSAYNASVEKSDQSGVVNVLRILKAFSERLVEYDHFRDSFDRSYETIRSGKSADVFVEVLALVNTFLSYQLGVFAQNNNIVVPYNYREKGIKQFSPGPVSAEGLGLDSYGSRTSGARDWCSFLTFFSLYAFLRGKSSYSYVELSGICDSLNLQHKFLKELSEIRENLERMGRKLPVSVFQMKIVLGYFGAMNVHGFEQTLRDRSGGHVFSKRITEAVIMFAQAGRLSPAFMQDLFFNQEIMTPGPGADRVLLQIIKSSGDTFSKHLAALLKAGFGFEKDSWVLKGEYA